jgi:hypothetical protein
MRSPAPWTHHTRGERDGQFAADFRVRLHAHLLSLPLRFHDTNKTGATGGARRGDSESGASATPFGRRRDRLRRRVPQRVRARLDGPAEWLGMDAFCGA